MWYLFVNVLPVLWNVISVFWNLLLLFHKKNRAKSKNLKHEVFEMCLDIRSIMKRKSNLQKKCPFNMYIHICMYFMRKTDFCRFAIYITMDALILCLTSFCTSRSGVCSTDLYLPGGMHNWFVLTWSFVCMTGLY